MKQMHKKYVLNQFFHKITKQNMFNHLGGRGANLTLMIYSPFDHKSKTCVYTGFNILVKLPSNTDCMPSTSLRRPAPLNDITLWIHTTVMQILWPWHYLPVLDTHGLPEEIFASPSPYPYCIKGVDVFKQFFRVKNILKLYI